MSVLNQSGEEQVECPLCMEPLEVDDLNFYPCTCGYQICRFCWHRIRTDENGLCPACRKAYSENPADFTPLSKEQVAQLKAEKRARDQQRKARLSESRKHLATVRVVQKNLVFVVGLPVRLADAEVLRRYEYFGKFGKIHKVVINQSTSYAGSQGPSASAYVTYYRSEDALRAIQSVNNITLDGRLIKSSLGTTKYCSHFMKNQPCPKPDCMYLHDLGDTEASFTKEEMHQGKHQEYERRLHEALAAQVQNKSLTNNASQPGQNVAPIQKEAWPSLSRNGSPPNVGKERKNSNSEAPPVAATSPSAQQQQAKAPSQQQQTLANSGNNNISSNKLNSSSNNETTTPPNSIINNNQLSSTKSPTILLDPTQVKSAENNNKPLKTKQAKLSKQNNENSNNLKNSQKSAQLQVNSSSPQVNPQDKLIISQTEYISAKQPQLSPPAATLPINLPSIENLVAEQNELETTSEDTDRSTSSSPITQSLNKMSLYEDNTSFFSPNTFQKILSDTENSGNAFLETNHQNSNILNDSLPDINSTEDWEAAFGFSTNQPHLMLNKETNNQSACSTSTTSTTNTRISLNHLPQSQTPHHLLPGHQSDTNGFDSQYSTQDLINSGNSFYSSPPNNPSAAAANEVNVGLINNSVFNTPDSNNLIRNTLYNPNTSELIIPKQSPQQQPQTAPIVNGLEQHMFKFFADFHKNSIKEQQHSDYLADPYSIQADFRHNFINQHDQQQQQLLAQQQQQQLIQQRLMEKHLSDQQMLMNMKNGGIPQQNGIPPNQQQPPTPNTLNFLNHGGYQQNFLLQNQINLVQNQHNLISGDRHNISLIGNQQSIAQQIIGNSMLNNGNRLGQQNSIQNLIGSNQQQQAAAVAAAQAAHFNQFNGQQQGAGQAHLLLSGSDKAQQQQRNVEDELGFDPFHETQKALAEMMESEQILTNQHNRARLPPPGFSHMNSFGIGLPRPHGSKILPFMSLGQTNNSPHQQQPNNLPPQQATNGWPVSNSQPPQNSGLGLCNDWTTLDPAIVSSSRHFPLVASMGAIREPYSTNQLPSVNSNVLRGLDFATSAALQHQPSNSYQQQSSSTFNPSPVSSTSATSLYQQQMQQQQSNSQYNGHLTNGYNSNSQTNTQTTSAIGQNWLNSTDYQNQIPLPPGFRQNNPQQGKTQEC